MMTLAPTEDLETRGGGPMNAVKLNILSIAADKGTLKMLTSVARKALPESVLLTAPNAMRGFELAGAENPDLILLDIEKREMDGMEVCRRLKADEQTRSIPIVFLTVPGANRESRVMAQDAGAEAVLFKPLNGHNLAALILAMAGIKAADHSRQPQKERSAAEATERPGKLENNLAARSLDAENLREKERRFRLLFDNMGKGFSLYELVADDQGKIIDLRYLDTNTIHDRIIGLEHKDIVGRTFLEVTPEADRQQIEYIGSTALSGVSHSFEYFAINWGKWIYVQTFCPKPGQVAAFFEDITERKRIEEANRRLNERMTLASKASGIGFWDWDIVKNRLVWDHQMYSLYGVKEEDFSGAYEAWIRGLHPDDQARGEIETNQALRGLKEYDTEFRIVRPDSSIRHLKAKAAVFRDGEGSPIRMIGVNYDITERKLSEEALRAKHELFRNTFYSSPLPSVLTKLPERKIVEVNPAFEKLFGYTHDETIGRSVDEYDLWADPSERERAAQRLLKSGKLYDLEFVFKTKSGETGNGIFYSEIIEQLDEKYVLTKVMDITERTRAAAQLRESKQIFAKIFIGSPVAMSIVSASTGKNINVNDAWCLLTGYSREEAIGYDTSELKLFYPEERSRLIREFSRLGYSKLVESELTAKDGEKKHILISSELIATTDNRLIIASVIDITERKRAELRLRQSEASLKGSQHNARLGSFEFDLHTGTWTRSEVLEELLGIDPSYERSIAGWMALVHPADQAMMTGFFLKKGPARDQAFDKEHRIIRRTDHAARWLWSRASLKCDADGQPATLSGTSLDISALKKAEEKLSQSEELFSKAFHTSPAGKTITRIADGMIINANESFFEMFGFKKDEVIGHTSTELNMLSPEERRKLIQLQLESGGLHNAELVAKSKSGQPITILFSSKSLELNGEPHHITTMIDITERKRIEEEVGKLNAELEARVSRRTAQLEEVNKELEAFSYSVSHDLRAPLRAVGGFTQMLLEGYESRLDDEGKRICSTISQSARDMGKLIDDLLAFSRAGRTAIQPSVIDMATLSRSVFFELTTPESRERIDFQVGSLPPAFGDPTLLRQVWINLISNAVKYSSKKKRAVIAVGAEADGGEIVYSIRDNGAGFDMRYKDKLFGVFQRLHSAKEFDGTGVGLALAHRIISRHGGRIWAEGEADQGAVFHFTIKEGRS